MKTSKGSRRRRGRRTDVRRRVQLLAAFDRSGLSAAAFARQHGLTHTTFCGWRQRRAKTKGSPGFVQVELSGAPAPAELVIELPSQVRLHLSSTGQIELAARLLHALNPTTAC